MGCTSQTTQLFENCSSDLKNVILTQVSDLIAPSVGKTGNS